LLCASLFTGLNDWAYVSSVENLALLREAESRIEKASGAYEWGLVECEKLCGFPSYGTAETLYHQSGYFSQSWKFRSRREGHTTSNIEELSDYEKSDYLGTLASIGGRGAALHGLAPLPPYL
jgi:hypothetical protein